MTGNTEFDIFVIEMYQQYKDEKLEYEGLVPHALLTQEAYFAKNYAWLKQLFKETHNG